MPTDRMFPLGTRVKGKQGRYGENIEGVVVASSVWTRTTHDEVRVQTSVGVCFNIERQYLDIIPALPRWV